MVALGSGFEIGVEERFSDTDFDPVVYRFTSSGALLGRTNLNSSGALVDQIAVGKNGVGTVAVWHDPSLNSGDIVAQRVDANGNTVGANFTVNSVTAGSQIRPDVAELSNGRLAFAWIDANTATVKVRIFDSAGANPSAEFQANFVAGDANFDQPHITALSSGGFVVAYETPAANFPDQAFGVRARIFDATGTLSGNEIILNSRFVGNQIAADIAALPGGGFVAVWYDTTTSGIEGQVFDAFGSRSGGEFIVNSTSFASLGDPNQISATTLPDGRVVVTWEGNYASGPDAGNGSVHSQIIDPRDGQVNGTSASETLYGNDLVNDEITALGGNDTLYGLGGNDALNGGNGTDTAVYTGSRPNYLLEKANGVLRLTDTRTGSPDGRDTLSSIEKINFNGATTSTETFTPRNFNGDLKSDIALYNDATGSSVVFLMDGLMATSGVAVGPANGASWDLVATGDLNGDSQSDMIWQNTSSGDVVGYIMNGSSIVSAAVIGSPGASFKVVGVGDLDADGNSDIVLQDGNGQAVVWFMNGDTITSAAGIGPANGAAWSIKAVGDLNGDSHADLVWQNTDGSTVGYLMNGSTIMAANQIAGAAGTNFSVKGIGDLNGDSYGDIVWQYSNGQAGVWLMNGTTITSAQGIGGANGAQWEIRDIADLNGDTKMDLVWEDLNAGQVVGFLMNGSTILGAANIGVANGSDWKVV